MTPFSHQGLVILTGIDIKISRHMLADIHGLGGHDSCFRIHEYKAYRDPNDLTEQDERVPALMETRVDCELRAITQTNLECEHA